MRNMIVAAAGLAMAGAANAQVFNFGSTGQLAGFNATATQNFNVPAGGPITGFSLTANMLEAGGGSWQSDMELQVTAPNGSMFTVGPTFGSPTTAWAANGTGTPPPDSNVAGPLNMSFNFAVANSSGNWTVRFRNAYSGAAAPADYIHWENVQVSLIPTPATAALLGLGGLVALRRRR